MKKQRFTAGLLACLLCVAIVALSLPAQAVASEKTGSLTINFENQETHEPLADVEFQIYLVATGSGVNYEWEDPFRGVSLGELKNLNKWTAGQWLDLVGAVSPIVSSLDYTKSGKTGSDGKLTLSDLEPGLYLVTGSPKEIGDKTYNPAPFFAVIPSTIDGKLVYDVEVNAKYDTSNEIRKTEVAINDELLEPGDVSEFGDYSIGPVVKVGDTITYQIYWNNYTTETADIVITDTLDEGVDFVSASVYYIKLSAPNDYVADDIFDKEVKITYDDSTHTVTWSLEKQETGASGYVSLTVQVNDKADSGWNYGQPGGDDSLPDHCVYNQATVTVGNESTDTNLVRNPLEGLFIEKIHVVVSDADTDGYFDGVFETDATGSDNPYELPLGAYDASNGLGFTERLDEDTEDNDYKKLFWHEAGNTVRYYIKVTNNTPDPLDHVVIVDPVKTDPVFGTQLTTNFGGVAGSVANEPKVQARTQTGIDIKRVSAENGIATFSLTPIWDSDWGEVNVSLQVTLPGNFTYESATFSTDVEGQAAYDEQTRTVTLTYETNTNELDTVSLHVKTDETAPELSIDNVVCFFDNILDTTSVTPTSSVGAVYNNDNPENLPGLENQGYLRWEIEELPGTNAVKAGQKSADGYDANVYIVWFDWDIPTDSVDETTLWENTAYVQTMEKIVAQLEPEPSVQTYALTRAFGAVATMALTQASEDSYEYGDKSAYSADSIFAKYSWPTIVGTMIASNTVQEAISPEQPDNPTDPTDPSNPDNPDDPSNPDNPDDPSNPDNPNNPNNPSKLPQTGQLWWPVPIMLGTGLLLIICGVILRKRGKKRAPVNGGSDG